MFEALRHGSAAAWAVVLMATLAGSALAADLTIAPGCTLPAGPVRAVTRILDGDTVQLDDGSELRLIGALAPHAHDAGADLGAWPPAEEARRTLSDLVLGKTVALAFGGLRTDRYGRWLAHAIVEPEGRKEWLQGHMLARGMARAYALKDNAACISDLLDLERPAREGSLGLWANAAYQIRSADSPRELLAYRHTFQLVLGRVATVSKARDATYLNFTKDRRGFAAVIKHSGQAPPGGMPPHDLQNRAVLARGWIDRRNGPVIEIDTAGQIELLDSPDAVGSLQRAVPRRYDRAQKRNVPGGRAAGHE
ncbi:MAG: thermonuclease family protein [Hyphomicrobiaceae bacterium]